MELEAIYNQWQEGSSEDEVADAIDGLVVAYQADETDKVGAEILSKLSGYLASIALDVEIGSPLAAYSRSQQAVIRQVEDLPVNSEEEPLDILLEAAVTAAHDMDQANGPKAQRPIESKPVTSLLVDRPVVSFGRVRRESRKGPYPPDKRMQTLQSQSASAEAKETAFSLIMNEYEGDLFRYARSILRTSSATDRSAEDIIQLTFLRLWENNDKFKHDPDNPLALKAWLVRLTHNLVMDLLRRKIQTPLSMVFDPREGKEARGGNKVMFSGDGQIDDPFERLNFGETLLELRQRLPSNFNALMLRGLGYSPVEIAELLGVSESAVHGSIHRGRRTVNSKPEFELFRKEHQISEIVARPRRSS